MKQVCLLIKMNTSFYNLLPEESSSTLILENIQR